MSRSAPVVNRNDDNISCSDVEHTQAEAWRQRGTWKSRRPLAARTRIMRDGIALALAEGPATISDIESRMGVTEHRGTLQRHIMQMEKDGKIKCTGVEQRTTRPGKPAKIWALTELSE